MRESHFSYINIDSLKITFDLTPFWSDSINIKGNYLFVLFCSKKYIEDLNDNKNDAKESHFHYINNSIILKSLMICPFWWALMGVITLKD